MAVFSFAEDSVGAGGGVADGAFASVSLPDAGGILLSVVFTPPRAPDTGDRGALPPPILLAGLEISFDLSSVVTPTSAPRPS